VNAKGELVGVVDDDESVRRGLRRLLKSAGYLAETFGSAENYLAREIFTGPICLILDIRMPGLNGLALQETLEARGGCEQIVFITGHGDVATCKRALKNGAVDFLTKPFEGDELIEAVNRALKHSRENFHKKGERREARGRIDKLTPREFEVLRFVIIGLLNKQIAAELSTAEKTIKVHRGRVMQKLGVTCVPDLVRISQRAGIMPAEPQYGTKVHYPIEA
jgi:FixJ family two-component response regulator